MIETWTDLIFAVRLSVRFKGYRPKPVTPKSVLRWLNQYPVAERPLLKKAALNLKFINENKFIQDLYDRNEALLQKLFKANIKPANIIYVSVSDAGSSSHAVLNLIRDKALLENRGCKLVDAGNVAKLNQLTTDLGSGAIIYVDDFAGTGSQFCEARGFIGDYIAGGFSEYFLLHTICEEAIIEVNKIGVAHWPYDIHEKRVRPLHENSTIFAANERERLTELSKLSAKRGALGYKDLASMIVFSRNTPNGTPTLFRGNSGQDKFVGLVPRTKDLPRPAM